MRYKGGILNAGGDCFWFVYPFVKVKNCLYYTVLPQRKKCTTLNYIGTCTIDVKNWLFIFSFVSLSLFIINKELFFGYYHKILCADNIKSLTCSKSYNDC